MSFDKQKDELINICSKLLNENEVSLILGFTKGEFEEKAIPLFLRKSEEIEKLKWDDSCIPNLAKYLIGKKEKAAIIAKPCDVRAISMYIAEKQMDRDSVYIVGVECGEMRDHNGEILSACAECKVKIPPMCDVLVSKHEDKENIPMVQGKGYNSSIPATDSLKGKQQKLTLERTLERFQNEMKKCILCFACRQACYGCYCTTCFIDSNVPNWSPGDPDIGMKMFFHLGRTMHLAGRCIECGACENACPSGVKIRYLIKELTKICEELYGYRAGMNPDEIPAMSAFAINDREIGFLGGDDGELCSHTQAPDEGDIE